MIHAGDGHQHERDREKLEAVAARRAVEERNTERQGCHDSRRRDQQQRRARKQRDHGKRDEAGAESSGEPIDGLRPDRPAHGVHADAAGDKCPVRIGQADPHRYRECDHARDEQLNREDQLIGADFHRPVRACCRN